MSIAASGAVSLSDLRTEFVGGSSAISFSQLYRGGSNIRAKAGNNTSTNLAASVPASGTVNFTNFRSTAKGFLKTYSSGATNQNASSVFGDDYGVSYPKQIVINSGVELGATSPSEEALQIDSGLSGGLTITNNGTLSGAGGVANSGTGGDAFQADVACTLINNGTIRGGGGGGGGGGSAGAGGTGGGGQYTTTNNYTSLSQQFSPYGQHFATNAPSDAYSMSRHNGTAEIYWRGSWRNWVSTAPTYSVNGGEAVTIAPYWNTGYCTVRWNRQSSSTTNTNGGSGGSGGGGGAGGRGQGYNHALAGGSSGAGGSGGAGGGTNAGAGGSGGTGGTGGSGASYGNSGGNGNSGATGNTGANGNRTGGVGGSSGNGGAAGGAAGKYIRGLSFVTLTQNGTVLGGTA